MIGFQAELGSLLRYLGIDLPDEGIWSEFTRVLSTKAFLRGKKNFGMQYRFENGIYFIFQS